MAKRSGPRAQKLPATPLPTVDDVFFLGPPRDHVSDRDSQGDVLPPSMVSSASPSPPSISVLPVQELEPAAEIIIWAPGRRIADAKWAAREIQGGGDEGGGTASGEEDIATAVLATAEVAPKVTGAYEHDAEATEDDVVTGKDWDEMSIEEMAKCISCDRDLAASIEQLHLISKDSSAIWSCSVPSCRQVYCFECTVGYTNVILAQYRVPACRKCKHPWNISLLRQSVQVLLNETDPIIPPPIHNMTSSDQQERLIAGIARFRQTHPGLNNTVTDSIVFLNWLIGTYEATGRSTAVAEVDRQAIMGAWYASFVESASISLGNSQVAPAEVDCGGNALAAAVRHGQAMGSHAFPPDSRDGPASPLRMGSLQSFSRVCLRGETPAATGDGGLVLRHTQSRRFDSLPDTPKSQKTTRCGPTVQASAGNTPQTTRGTGSRVVSGSRRSGISHSPAHPLVSSPGRQGERPAALRYNPWTPCQPRVFRTALDILQDIDYPGTLSHLMDLKPLSVHSGIREQVLKGRPPTLYSHLRLTMENYEIVSEFRHYQLHQAMMRAAEEARKATIEAEAKAMERRQRKEELRKWQGEHPTQAKVRHVLSLYDLRKTVSTRFGAWMDGALLPVRADEKKPPVECEKVGEAVQVKPTAVVEGAAGDSEKTVKVTEPEATDRVRRTSRLGGIESSMNPSIGTNLTSVVGSAPTRSASSLSETRAEEAAGLRTVPDVSENNRKGVTLQAPRAVVKKRSSFFGRLKIWGAN